MTVCEICKKRIYWPCKISLNDGSQVCRECVKEVARPFKAGRHWNLSQLKIGISYRDAVKKMGLAGKFRSDYSYGRMHIDASNGIVVFCPADNILRDGSLMREVPNIYHILIFSDYEFTFTVKSRSMSGKPECEVYFTAFIEKYAVHIQEKIKSYAKVNVLSDDDEYFLSKPAKLARLESVYVTTFNRQARLANEELKKRKAKENVKTLNQEATSIMIEKAKTLFMLEDTYTKSDLKRQRDLLMKSFHPDNGVRDRKYATTINQAYKLLLSTIS